MAANQRMVLSEALGLATPPREPPQMQWGAKDDDLLSMLDTFLLDIKAPVFGSRGRCESRSTSADSSADSSPQKSSADGTPRLPACVRAPPGLEDYRSPATSDIMAMDCPFGMPPGLEGLLDFMLDAEAQLPPPPAHAPTLPPSHAPTLPRARGPPSAPPPFAAPPVHEAPVFSKDLMPPPPPVSPGAAGMPPPPAGWPSCTMPVMAPPPLESAPVLEDSWQLPPPPARSPAGAAAPLGLAESLSAGSAGHFAGLCKPCAFWHNKGCGNGAQCSFCHLCPPGEKQRRKNTRKQLARLCTQLEQPEWGPR